MKKGSKKCVIELLDSRAYYEASCGWRNDSN